MFEKMKEGAGDGLQVTAYTVVAATGVVGALIIVPKIINGLGNLVNRRAKSSVITGNITVPAEAMADLWIEMRDQIIEEIDGLGKRISNLEEAAKTKHETRANELAVVEDLPESLESEEANELNNLPDEIGDKEETK